MLALSIRQPWAELILRGIKTVEYRSRPTRIIGQRFHIYAAGTWPPGAASGRRMEEATRVWSNDLAMPAFTARGVAASDAPPAWMVEMLAQLLQRDLPTGVIVGSAVIEKVTPPAAAQRVGRRTDADDGLFRWHLADVRRASSLRKPDRHPQPSWFEPF